MSDAYSASRVLVIPEQGKHIPLAGYHPSSYTDTSAIALSVIR